MTPSAVLEWLESQASEDHRQSLARYGIPSENALGVPMGVMKKKAKAMGYNHALALALWAKGGYEARTMAAHLADPSALTGATMDTWAEGFDNWAICDTCCYQLFAKAAPRWEKAHAWARREEEFVKRAAFALIWALSRQDKMADDAAFEDTFPLMEAASTDARPLVSKAIDMALRATGKRNFALNETAAACAERLAQSKDPHSAKVGRKAFKELTSEKVRARL